MTAIGRPALDLRSLTAQMAVATPSVAVAFREAFGGLVSPTVPEPGINWRDYIGNTKMVPGTPFDPTQPPNATSPDLLPDTRFIYGNWQDSGKGPDYLLDPQPDPNGGIDPGLDDAIWMFDNLPPGRYQVATHYLPDPSLSTKVFYVISFEDGDPSGTATINQRALQADITKDGRSYQLLGTFDLKFSRQGWVRMSKYQHPQDGRMMSGRVLMRMVSQNGTTVPDVPMPTQYPIVLGTDDIVPVMVVSQVQSNGLADTMKAYQITAEQVWACFNFQIDNP